MLSAQGWESRSTETSPVKESTFAASSADLGNNWAEQIGASASTSSAPSHLRRTLGTDRAPADDATSLHKVNEKPGRFHTKVLCGLLLPQDLTKTVYHQKCVARRYPIGLFVKNLYGFSSFEVNGIR